MYEHDTIISSAYWKLGGLDRTKYLAKYLDRRNRKICHLFI